MPWRRTMIAAPAAQTSGTTRGPPTGTSEGKVLRSDLSEALVLFSHSFLLYSPNAVCAARLAFLYLSRVSVSDPVDLPRPAAICSASYCVASHFLRASRTG